MASLICIVVNELDLGCISSLMGQTGKIYKIWLTLKWVKQIERVKHVEGQVVNQSVLKRLQNSKWFNHKKETIIVSVHFVVKFSIEAHYF